MVEATQEERMGGAMCTPANTDSAAIAQKLSAASGIATLVPENNTSPSNTTPTGGADGGIFGNNQSNNEPAPTGNNESSTSGIGTGNGQYNNNPASAESTIAPGPKGKKQQHFKTLRRWGTLGRSKLHSMPGNENLEESGTSSATSFSEKKSLGKRIGGKIKAVLTKEKTKFKI